MSDDIIAKLSKKLILCIIKSNDGFLSVWNKLDEIDHGEILEEAEDIIYDVLMSMKLI